MRWLLPLLLTLLIPPAMASEPRHLPDGSVDKLLLLKGEHRLHLLQHGQVVRSYRISLGREPAGAKRFEGDMRTPEGYYWIDWRKPSAKYNLSMHISYPNQRDLDYARRAGRRPGGMIMIHGTPIDAEYDEQMFHTLDWTEGCIAMLNADMREVWRLVKDNTLIEIRP